MLRFPYQDEYFTGSPPPSRPPGVMTHKRPLIPITIIGPNASQNYDRALVDTGADDTLFPIATALHLGVPLHAHLGHGVRWRGQMHAMDARFLGADLAVELEANRTYPGTQT